MGFDQLAASGVSEDTAGRAGVYVVTTAEARALGFIGGHLDGVPLDGLAFLYRDPRTGALLVTRLRPDVPVNGRRYLAPVGSRNHFYIPCLIAGHLADVRFDALITEGEKKTLALVEAVGTRYLVMGIGGVWNWRTSPRISASPTNETRSNRIGAPRG